MSSRQDVKMDREPAWGRAYALFKKRDAETGELIKGPVMARKTPAGGREYRKMTEAEMAAYLADDAW